MSITITQQPSTLALANNDNIYVISGSTYNPLSGFTDYKYIADVYANGDLRATLKAFPDPIYGFGSFNMRNIAPSLVDPTFHHTLAQDIAAPMDVASADYNNVRLQFGEEYINPRLPLSSQFVQNLDLAISTLVPYIDGAIPFHLQPSFIPSNYVMSGGTTSGKLFLTNGPGSFTPAPTNLRRWLYYYTLAGQIVTANITTFNVTGAQLGQYTINNPNLGTSQTQLIAVGHPQLAALPTSGYTVVSGASTMMNQDVTSYTINVGNTFAAINSETIEFQVKCDFSRYAPYAYQVHWLNTLGGFDSWLFNRKNEASFKKTQTIIKKNYGHQNADGTFSINSWDRNRQAQYTQLQESVQMSTDFLTDSQLDYLKGLFGSPYIFVEGPDGILRSATVQNDSFIVKRRVNYKNYSLSLTLDMSSIDTTQST